MGWTCLVDSAIEEALTLEVPDFNEKGNTLNDVLRIPKLLVNFLSETTDKSPQKHNLNDLRLF